MSELDEKALKPCPFCGGISDLQQNGIAPRLYWEVVCDACDFTGPAHDPAEQAIAAWNRRASPAPPGERGAPR